MYGNGRQSVELIVAHLVVVVIGLIAASVLTFTGHLDSSAYTVIVGVLVGLVGGGGAILHGAAVGASQPHRADTIIADQAAPIPGGRRNYDPPSPAEATRADHPDAPRAP